MPIGIESLIEISKRIELYAIWETADGAYASLVCIPENDDDPGILAAVRVRDEKAAWKLQQLLDPQ